MPQNRSSLPPYRHSIAGTLLRAREVIMAPLRAELRAANFTEQQWRVLRVLAGEGQCNTTELSKASLLHAPSVTRILRELEDRGLVSRAPDEADARQSIVSITDLGHATMADVWTSTTKILKTYSDRFGKERLDNLLAELDALTATLGKNDSPL